MDLSALGSAAKLMELPVRIHTLILSASRKTPAWLRAVIALAALALCIRVTYVRSALAAPNLVDERTWVDRSLKPLTAAPEDPTAYYYAVHHPSFARIVYRAVLHRMGVYELDRPLVDYELSAEENYARGAFVPPEIKIPLRLVNVAFLSAMVLLVYLGYNHFFHNRALAVAGCLPLLFNPSISTFTCPYIGTDSMLLFWVVAFWFVWVMARNDGFWKIFALGVIGGLMVSTKVNTAFVLAAAAVYYGAKAKGIRRLLWPLLLVVLPLAVFIALNPVYRQGDFAWAVKVAKDVLGTMVYLKEKSTSHDWAQFTKVEILRESFPYWLLFLPTLAVFAASRRQSWFAPTAVWAAGIIVPNVLLIYVPLPRYCAIISAGFLVFFCAAGIHTVLGVIRSSESPGTLPRPSEVT